MRGSRLAIDMTGLMDAHLAGDKKSWIRGTFVGLFMLLEEPRLAKVIRRIGHSCPWNSKWIRVIKMFLSVVYPINNGLYGWLLPTSVFRFLKLCCSNTYLYCKEVRKDSP